jgi:chromosome segregation ATPase
MADLPEDLRVHIDWPAREGAGHASPERHEANPAAVEVREEQPPVEPTGRRALDGRMERVEGGLARLTEESAATRSRLDTLTEAVITLRSLLSRSLEDVEAAVSHPRPPFAAEIIAAVERSGQEVKEGVEERAEHTGSRVREAGGDVAEALGLVADRLERLAKRRDDHEEVIDALADALDDIAERIDQVEMVHRDRHKALAAMVRTQVEAAQEIRTTMAEVLTVVDKIVVRLDVAERMDTADGELDGDRRVVPFSPGQASLSWPDAAP